MIHFCKLLDANTGELHRHLDPKDISEVRQETGKVIWLDIQDGDDADMALLKDEFCFHPLAIEDCRTPHQRPKLDQYDGFMFFVLYEAADADGKLQTTELSIFLGANYVVSVHHGPAPVIDSVQTRWEANVELNEEGASYLAYLLVDAVVDSYFPMLDAFSDRLDLVETRIFDHFDERIIQAIFTLKKDTLALRRLATPLRDVFLVLLRGPDAMFGPKTHLYFQDVLDHLLRVSDAIDVQRDLVSSALDAYQSAVSNRTNDTMKKLTVLSAVLMTAALIAGIFGMNFVHMPELSWPMGYFGALYMMVMAGLVLVAAFRWKGYIGARRDLEADDSADMGGDTDKRRVSNLWVALMLAGVGGPLVLAPYFVARATAPVVTRAQYARLTTGMAYGEVRALIGTPGEETLDEDDGRTARQTYRWTNPDGTTAEATFLNGRLGLKSYGRPR